MVRGQFEPKLSSHGLGPGPVCRSRRQEHVSVLIDLVHGWPDPRVGESSAAVPVDGRLVTGLGALCQLTLHVLGDIQCHGRRVLGDLLQQREQCFALLGRKRAGACLRRGSDDLRKFLIERHVQASLSRVLGGLCAEYPTESGLKLLRVPWGDVVGEGDSVCGQSHRCCGDSAWVLVAQDLLETWLRECVDRFWEEFARNPTTAHLVRHGCGCSGAREAVEHDVAGVGGDVDDALQQALRLGCCEAVLVVWKHLVDVVALGLLVVPNFISGPPGSWH